MRHFVRRTRKSSSIHLLFIVIILLVVFHLRLDDVGNWPLRWDEAFSVWFGQMDLSVSTERTANDIHPPLYFWLFHIWIRLTGISEFAIRSFSVFLGLITTAVTYALTLRLSGRRLAASTALVLIALSPYHITWSQDARMYALATMSVGLTAYAYLRGWTRSMAIGGIATALSHYFGAFAIVIIVIHRVIYWRDLQRNRRQFVIAILVTASVCLLWAVYAIGLIRRDSGHAEFDLQHTFQLLATLYTVSKSTDLHSYVAVVLFILLVFLSGIILSWLDNRRATSLVILGCILPPVILSVLSLPVIPFYVTGLADRHFVVFAPFVFSGYGLGLSAMIRRRRVRAVGMLLLTGFVVLNGVLVAEKRDARYFKDDYRSMMAAVAALTDTDDKIYFTSGGRKPVVYYHLDRVGYDVPKNQYAEPVNVIGIPRSSDDVEAMMNWVFAGVSRFWLIEIEAHHDAPLDARTNWLNENYYRIYHIPVGWNGISLYSAAENDAIPNVNTVIPPVVTEARPGDQVRIGVPAGVTVDLVHSGQVIDSHRAETWMLHQFDIYPFYFNGFYELRAEEESYPFVITHSQDFPGGDS